MEIFMMKIHVNYCVEIEVCNVFWGKLIFSANGIFKTKLHGAPFPDYNFYPSFTKLC